MQRNYACPGGEIDLVAEEGGTLVFVEVKTRQKGGNELPEAAVTNRKKRRLCKAARHFMNRYKIAGRVFRFDVVGLEFTEDDRWEIHHWPNVIDYRRHLARKR